MYAKIYANDSTSALREKEDVSFEEIFVVREKLYPGKTGAEKLPLCFESWRYIKVESAARRKDYNAAADIRTDKILSFDHPDNYLILRKEAVLSAMNTP